MSKIIYFLIVFGLTAGITSCTKDTGPEGPKGEKGEIGFQGIPGTDGKLIHSGNGVPENAVGNVGDFYIDKQNAKLYGPKASGGWGPATDMRGLAGSTGPKGEAGVAGSQFLSGNLPPTSVLGNTGDFYFSSSTGELFGPKSSNNTWPLGVSLKGPKGDPGNANVKKYKITVEDVDWLGPYDAGDGNIFNYFEVPTTKTGNIAISDANYFVMAYATPNGLDYMEKKQLPYVFSQGSSYGLMFETLIARNYLTMSKTTNGWNFEKVPLSQMPKKVEFELLFVEIGLLNSLKNTVDFTDLKTVEKYFQLEK